MNLGTEESALSQNELKTILEADQYTGALDEVLLDLIEKSAGISAKFEDDNCYQITYTDSGFRVVFGNCILNSTENVNGELEVIYTAGTGSTSFTATYTDFFVGAIQLNGNRAVDISQSEGANIVLEVRSDMTVVLENGTVLTEKGSKALEIDLGASLSGATYSLIGDWTVSDGDTVYGVTISQPLIGNLQCEYVVSGLMDIDKNGLNIGVDFGDGTCDNLVTLIYPDGSNVSFEL